MGQIRFTVSKEAAGYLRWLARNVLFVKTEDEAAKHLMMTRLEQIRRQHYQDEPNANEIAPSGADDEGEGPT